MKSSYTAFLLSSSLILSIHSCFGQPGNKLDGFNCSVFSSFNTGAYGIWGLDWDGEFLWAAFNKSGELQYVYKLDTDGHHIDSIQIPDVMGNQYADLEVSGNDLWLIQESSGLLLKIDLASKSLVKEDTLPDNGPDENYFSVAYDGQFLWVINYSTADLKHRLFKADPNTLELLDSVDLSHFIIVLEMINNELWGVCGSGQCYPAVLFRIDPNTGAFTDSSEWCLGASLFGMAWDGQYVWESAGVNHDVYHIDIGFQIGINDLQGEEETQFFPNPSKGHFSISLANNQNGLFRVQLVNIVGAAVLDDDILFENGVAEIELPAGLKGTFLLRILREEDSLSQLLVVQ